MKLSACLIVKNEQELLARCLDKLTGVDELIICDTGSEDKTVDIAKKYTDKVFTDYKWDDNFAKARNHAIKKCTGDWILIVDADDTFEPDAIKKIRKVIEIAKEEQLVFNFLVTSKDTHFYQPRLFRNNKGIWYKGAIHNCLNTIQDNNVPIKITSGYSPAHKKDPDRALRILKKEVSSNPKLVREKFYLAREYLYQKDYVTALYWYKEYFKVASWGPEKAEAYLQMARCSWALQNGEQARDYCLQAIKINADFKEALLFMAELSWVKNKAKWLQYAELAESKDVLFNRVPKKKGDGN